jgi:ammonia channel protein AmtB
MDEQTISHLINLYDQNFDQKIESNSMNTIVQGVFLLFFTWLFFNGASGFTIVDRTQTNLP